MLVTCISAGMHAGRPQLEAAAWQVMSGAYVCMQPLGIQHSLYPKRKDARPAIVYPSFYPPTVSLYINHHLTSSSQYRGKPTIGPKQPGHEPVPTPPLSKQHPRSGIHPPEEYWTPELWGEWVYVERKLLAQRRKVMSHRDHKLQAQMRNVIKNDYQPDGEARLSDESVGRVAEKIGRTLCIFNNSPLGLLAGRMRKSSGCFSGGGRMAKTWKMPVSPSQQPRTITRTTRIHDSPSFRTCCWLLSNKTTQKLGKAPGLPRD